jgi:ribosomal protein L33
LASKDGSSFYGTSKSMEVKLSRLDYVKYDELSQNDQVVFKTICADLEDQILCRLGPGRASSLAITKLEECYMWIGKGIRDSQVARDGKAPLMEERSNS